VQLTYSNLKVKLQTRFSQHHFFQPGWQHIRKSICPIDMKQIVFYSENFSLSPDIAGYSIDIVF